MEKNDVAGEEERDGAAAAAAWMVPIKMDSEAGGKGTTASVRARKPAVVKVTVPENSSSAKRWRARGEAEDQPTNKARSDLSDWSRARTTSSRRA